MASAPTPVLESVSARSLLVAPVRLALGLAGLGVSAIAADDPEAALIAFLVGALGILVAVLASRRSLAGPQPAPPDARYAGPAELIRSAIFPSTVGVAVLTALASPFRPILGALLAGLLAGMGLGAAVYGAQLYLRERAEGISLYVGRGTKRLYLRPHEDGPNDPGAAPT